MKEQDVKIKKTYYQTSVFFQIIISIFLAAFIVFQAYAIKIVILIITCIMNNDLKNVGGQFVIFLILEIGALLMLRIIIRFEHNNIYIRGNKIYMNDDWMPKKEKIQRYAEVYIEDIKSIDIIGTPKKKRKLSATISTSVIPLRAYIVFETMKGKKVKMFIFYMSKKTIRTMINDIKELMKEHNNFNPIEDTETLIEKL